MPHRFRLCRRRRGARSDLRAPSRRPSSSCWAAATTLSMSRSGAALVIHVWGSQPCWLRVSMGAGYCLIDPPGGRAAQVAFWCAAAYSMALCWSRQQAACRASCSDAGVAVPARHLSTAPANAPAAAAPPIHPSTLIPSIPQLLGQPGAASSQAHRVRRHRPAGWGAVPAAAVRTGSEERRSAGTRVVASHAEWPAGVGLTAPLLHCRLAGSCVHALPACLSLLPPSLACSFL